MKKYTDFELLIATSYASAMFSDYLRSASKKDKEFDHATKIYQEYLEAGLEFAKTSFSDE